MVQSNIVHWDTKTWHELCCLPRTEILEKKDGWLLLGVRFQSYFSVLKNTLIKIELDFASNLNVYKFQALKHTI